MRIGHFFYNMLNSFVKSYETNEYMYLQSPEQVLGKHKIRGMENFKKKKKKNFFWLFKMAKNTCSTSKLQANRLYDALLGHQKKTQIIQIFFNIYLASTKYCI